MNDREDSIHPEQKPRTQELERSARAARPATSIQSAREDERKRIARELHDDLGQNLTALKMALADLEKLLRESGIITAPSSTRVRDMECLIDMTVASLRRIASGMRPVAFETLGLAAAIERLVEEFVQRYGIEVDARFSTDDLGLEPSAEENLFHIVQEALTNVARHACAGKITIDLKRAGNIGILHISDNGRGTALSMLDGGSSLGLIGMRERADEIEGTLSLDSGPGRGFRVHLTFPIPPTEDAVSSPISPLAQR
ncbi:MULTISPECIES: sensor histidine kinase [unclassified Caballeronia]|uniref:sensor histidine kinase n=1 Tax=unclassified Caballeronia TaxID=2646786 RepID=UPI002866C9A4|nr:MULTISPECIES: sensor histidine kinase [unclassified Caballeronia]MDR5777494.1 sensor histidine kinase [Caballeronia sp. LZ002]MDR5798555.1 sensor histidine kinase [Caballeronia sp. LZ001]MDR5852912.1 sensor histidine kinase [Caballeronia sp. LZ003]